MIWLGKAAGGEAEVIHENAEKAKALEHRWIHQRGLLAAQLPTLTDGEMAQVLERYSDVVTL